MPLQENDDTFYIKQGSTTPALEVQLIDENDNLIDLSVVDGVDFRMYEPRTGDVMLEEPATVTDGENGQVTYVWKDTDTDEAGRFRSEFVVHYDSNSAETFPNFGYRDVLVWGTNDAPTGTAVDTTYPADAGDY